MDRALEMQVFCAVVENGSFIAATEAMGLSKAAVSRHVAALEERLGVRLLQRTTRRIALTEEGRLFHQQAREVLELMELAERSVAANEQEPSGILRINAPVSFGIQHLGPLWPAFMSLYPKIELDITLNDRLVDLLEEGYDLVVRIAQMENSSLVGRRLATTRMRLCASPGYLESHPALVHPRNLLEHKVIAYSHFASGSAWSFIGPEGEISVQTQSVVRCNNGDTCRAIALGGGGILLQPSFMLHDDLQRGELVEVLPGYRAVTLGIYAVYPSRKFLAPRVRALVDYLAQRFAMADWDG